MITVLGSSGFIGQRLNARLEELKVERYTPARNETVLGRKLGHVIYCIGLTADFRSRPFDTVEAHVCKLLEVLREADFDSLLYLSSTRLYALEGLAAEEDALRIAPLDPSDLYNISKAMGESITLNCGRNTRVARISNVYGGDFASDNFLATLIRESVTRKKLVLQTSSASAKDYVAVDDVVTALVNIASSGRERIYNVAGGINVSNNELVASLSNLTGCVVEFSPGAPTLTFPQISIERMQAEFKYTPSQVLNDMAHLVNLYKDNEGIPA